MSPQSTPLNVSQRLALILQTLRDSIAARAGRDWAVAGIVLLAWPYLHRLAARFAALAQRVEAGQSAAALPRPRAASLAPRCRPPRPRPPGVPRGFGWMIRLDPAAGAIGGQFRYLLSDPALASLLLAEPRTGRILRPLCWMLGIAPGPDLPRALFQSSRPPEPPTPTSNVLQAREASSRPPDLPTPVTPVAPGPTPQRRARTRFVEFRALPA